MARVCQEAGAHVVRNARLADMNLDVPVQDGRRIEVVATGLPLWRAPRVEARRAWTQRGAAPANAKNRRPLLRSRRLPRQQIQQRRAGSGGRARARGKSGGACGVRLLRWSRLLAVAAQRAYASSLPELPLGGESCAAPELLADARWELPASVAPGSCDRSRTLRRGRGPSDRAGGKARTNKTFWQLEDTIVGWSSPLLESWFPPWARCACIQDFCHVLRFRPIQYPSMALNCFPGRWCWA